MHYFFDVSIPHSRTEAAPYTEILKLTRAVITRLQIVIPSGAIGLSHLVLKYHEFQLYPLSRGENYHGDDLDIAFDEFMPLVVAPYELKAVGWNTDTANDHSFLIGIAMQTEDEIGAPIPPETLANLQDMIGEVV